MITLFEDLGVERDIYKHCTDRDPSGVACSGCLTRNVEKIQQYTLIARNPCGLIVKIQLYRLVESILISVLRRRMDIQERLARSEYHTQLVKMRFDKIFDLTAGVNFHF